jgi:hypothetical protein
MTFSYGVGIDVCSSLQYNNVRISQQARAQLRTIRHPSPRDVLYSEILTELRCDSR